MMMMIHFQLLSITFDLFPNEKLENKKNFFSFRVAFSLLKKTFLFSADD